MKAAFEEGDDNTEVAQSIALPYRKQSSSGILFAAYGVRDVTSVVRSYIEAGNISLRADDLAFGSINIPRN